MIRLLLAAAAARASNRGHEVAQFVRARAGLLKSIVLFRTHVDDALTVRIYRTLHASLNNAKNYELSILYDPDALPTCCAQFDKDAASIRFGLRDFEENYPNVELQMHKNKGQPWVKKSHYQQLAYAFALRGKDYEFAWCVEHDVALTGGNWLGFYEAHANDSRDLLAWRVGWVPKDAKPHKGGAWNAGMMTGPRFDCFQNGRGGWPFSTCHGGHAEVAILFGAIVRYSSRFASLLDQDGAADPPSYGHSETAVPTLCNITQCGTMGNISDAWVGINDYLLDPPIDSAVFDEIEKVLPGKLMHPVRDTVSSSSFSSVDGLARGVLDKPKQARARVINGVFHAPAGRHEALCLLANPRPFQPSFSCPVGCPHHVQEACPTRNCVWGKPNATYVHLAAKQCVVECGKEPGRCPFATSKGSSVSLLEAPPGGFPKKANVARRRGG